MNILMRLTHALSALQLILAPPGQAVTARGAISVELPAVTPGPSDTLPTDTLPTDTAYTIGTLPNGLRYYIRHNVKPAPHRVELRLVVRAGSLMETEDQRGGAHFVEHMAFRGTAHFKGTEIVDYLQSIGVKFGADLNAQTTFDHTTYELTIPTDTLAHVRTGLQILDDWAHGVAFGAKDLEEERAIILGERRMRLGATQRMADKELAAMLAGSRYPDRMPIGTEASVTHMSREQLVAFYRKWYRPDRMAVIAIGDIDPRQMARMIRQQFSDIPTPATPLANPKYPIPAVRGTQVTVMRDPEVTASVVRALLKGPPFPRFTDAAERADIKRVLFDQMMNQRLSDMVQRPNVPFVQAEVSHSVLMTPDVGVAELQVVVPDSGPVLGMDALVTEVARVGQHGFTAAEFDRATRSLNTTWDNTYINRNDQASAALVDACIDNFLTGEALPSVDASVARDRRLLPTVSVAAVDSEVADWQTTSDRILWVSQPDKPTVPPVDTAALLAIWPSVGARTLAAYDDPGGSASGASGASARGGLMAERPAPGTIVAERRFPSVGITQWTLSNGVVVFLKPTTFDPDQVILNGLKPGGWSVLGDSAYPTVRLAQELSGTAKAGPYDQVALSRALTGRTVGVQTSVTGVQETLLDVSRTSDVETMLQLAYLHMTALGYDSVAVDAFTQKKRMALANEGLSPDAVFMDTLMTTLVQHSPRWTVMTPAVLDRIDTRRALALYKDRYADADGFAFLLVGAFNLDSLKPLVEAYLGGLPALHRHEVVQDRPAYHPPIGPVVKTIVAGRESKTTTMIAFAGSFSNSRATQTDLAVLADVLQNTLRDRLREQLGGTYNVGVAASHDPAPINGYTVQIQFTSDPARRAELVKAAFAVIDTLQSAGPSGVALQQAVAPRLRELEQGRQTNFFWLNALPLYQEGRPFDDLLDNSEITAMTPARVRAAARQYLSVQR
ncbi:MAG TPA: insulinase family protein, partial [Gemmatimonadaceae bacterium]|nr:insulinase family protein [Gemmatimonadaceae bacterium]